MTLSQWLDNRWLVEHKTSRQEIRELFELVERDLNDATVHGLSNDWKLVILYNAALQCGTIGLASSGYRVSKGGSHHYYTIESMALTFGVSEEEIRTLDAYRKKRNIIDYKRLGRTTDTEIQELMELVKNLHNKLAKWISDNHPELLDK